jgi:hypothetical protein
LKREGGGHTLDCVDSTSLIVSIEILEPLAHDESQLDLIVKVDTLRTNDWPFTR